MTASPVTQLSAAFAALADPKRLAVVNALREGPRRAGELADVVSTPPAALSRHLRVLRRCGLVSEDGIEQDARVRVYRLNPQGISSIQDWTTGFEELWAEQLKGFKAFAEGSSVRRRPTK